MIGARLRERSYRIRRYRTVGSNSSGSSYMYDHYIPYKNMYKFTYMYPDTGLWQ